MKLKIELTKKQEEMLKQYATIYNHEMDYHCTTAPISVVEKREAVPAAYGHHDKFVYIVKDESTVYEELGKLMQVYEYELVGISESTIKDLVPYDDYHRFNDIEIGCFGVVYEWRPIAYFLTRKEADSYRRYQAHNLGVSRTYTRNIGYSNEGDLAYLLPLLKSMGDEIIQKEEDQE